MSKFDTIKRFNFDLNIGVPECKPVDDSLLLYYICVHSPWYLKMLVVSIASMLKNTDMQHYNVTVYLDNGLSVLSQEVEFLKRAGVRICWVNRFIPKFEVPFLDENRKYKKFLCLDCDTFATPNYPIFKDMVRLESGIACRSACSGVKASEQIIARQFQSQDFKNKTPESFIGVIKIFLSTMGVDTKCLDDVTWHFGFVVMFDTRLLANKIWSYTFYFINRYLKTTCDETLYMLCYWQQPDIILDLKDYRLYVGYECYTPMALNQGSIVHPILGDVPRNSKNLDILNYCLGGPNPLTLSNWARCLNVACSHKS